MLSRTNPRALAVSAAHEWVASPETIIYLEVGADDVGISRAIRGRDL